MIIPCNCEECYEKGKKDEQERIIKVIEEEMKECKESRSKGIKHRCPVCDMLEELISKVKKND